MADDDEFGGYGGTSSARARPGRDDDEFDLGGAAPSLGALGARGGTAAKPQVTARALSSAMGVKPGTATRPGTASTKAAGYGTRGGTGSGPRGSIVPSSAKRGVDDPEERCRRMEAAVNSLFETSALLGVKGDNAGALENARLCVKEEKKLTKLRDEHGLRDAQNPELTFAVTLNLANRLAKTNGATEEALATYNEITSLGRKKNDGSDPGGGGSRFPKHAANVRVNSGNVHYQQKDFVRAIKSYRVALDQVGARNKQLRGKITANIACAFARMGQYVDAASTFEDVVDLRNFSAGVNSHDAKKTPDVATRFNLVVCHFALGDAPAMRNAFTGLLRLRAFESDDGEDEEDVPAGVGARGVSGIAGDDGYQEIVGDGKDGDANGGDANPKPKRNNARSDLLTAETAVRRKNARGVIIDAAMLIGPEIASTPELGWEELAREMRAFGYKSLANKLEMQKALGYLSTKTNQGRFEDGRKSLRSFQTLENQLAVADASVNISFMLLHEDNLPEALRFAELGVVHDPHDPNALVNKGCVFMKMGDDASLQNAMACFDAALRVDENCVQAEFNLGLANKRLQNVRDAIGNFSKVLLMVPEDAHVGNSASNANAAGLHVEALYQLGDLNDALGDARGAARFFEKVRARVSNDCGVLRRLGNCAAKLGDDQKASAFYNEAHTVCPNDVDACVWLGSHHARSERFEKARAFFTRAALAETRKTHRIKWRLAAASCLRKSGDSEAALAGYLTIHKEHPNDVECLRHMAHVCGDLYLEDDARSWGQKLRVAERERDAGAADGDEKKKDAFDHGSLLPLQAGTRHDSPVSPQSPSPLERSRSGVSEDEWGNGDLDLPGM